MSKNCALKITINHYKGCKKIKRIICSNMLLELYEIGAASRLNKLKIG